MGSTLTEIQGGEGHHHVSAWNKVDGIVVNSYAMTRLSVLSWWILSVCHFLLFVRSVADHDLRNVQPVDLRLPQVEAYHLRIVSSVDCRFMVFSSVVEEL